MKARDLLRAIEAYGLQHADPDVMLKQMPDEQFRTAVIVAATLLRTLKMEAIRRGIWDELKVKRP